MQPFQTEYTSKHGHGKNIWIIVIYIYIKAYVIIKNTSLHKMSMRSMFQPRVEEAEIHGKPSHNSWLELSFTVPIEPSSHVRQGWIWRHKHVPLYSLVFVKYWKEYKHWLDSSQKSKCGQENAQLLYCSALFFIFLQYIFFVTMATPLNWWIF